MSSCSIKWCGKNSKTSNYNTDGISFHRFPKDPVTKDAWLSATKRENWFPSNYSVLCSRHFTSDCFEQLSNRRRLYKSAVPTLLLPHLKSDEEKAVTEDNEPANIEASEDCIDVDTNEESTNCQIIKSNNLLIKSVNSISKKVLCRKITDLTMRLRKTNLLVRRLQDSNRVLKEKLNSHKKLMEKLKNKDLLTQENIDMNRLQNCNSQLRKKVVWLRKLLVEQKKKNSGVRNVVWCPAADESILDAKNE